MADETQTAEMTQTEPGADADDWAAAMAEQTPGAATAPPEVELAPEAAAQRAPFPELRPDVGHAAYADQLDLVMDIPVTLSVELGRTKIQIRELLQLAQGSVVDLDRLAGEPMDVLVNGFLIARGEVVLVNDKFGIRLTDIVSPTERARRLA
ncbi:flagellar motor switching and energizing component [Thiomonas sp. X19]|uniref:flagellar motor switch protein FliN n=1 Tax=Thiomonas sp. X19 TaxID=1050370 RepID=UPI000B7369BD|nr:flagellar motor switch protein FliN [Thiomonas sp. X19]SCC91043.1 flagellar motor switching and energizing component [Thiomonas sp. X19]